VHRADALARRPRRALRSADAAIDGGAWVDSMRRWTFALLCGLALSAGAAGAQDYPTRPVRIVVPFGAGGPADVYARIVGQHLQTALGQPFVIENRPGAGAVNGTAAAAQAAPDGHTLLLMSNAHTANETLIPGRGYDLLRDFTPVAPLNFSELVLVVNPSVPAQTLAEFIALARRRPGELNYASSGTGTPYHMAGELFKALSGTNIQHVPHRSSGGARADVLAGHQQMMIDAVSTMTPMIVGGQVRALATTGTSRPAILPNVPTAAEAGLPGYEATIWLGVMAPRGTPDAVVQRLNREIAAFVSRPETRSAWAAQGVTPMTMSPAEFRAYVERDIAKWAGVIRTANIQPE
jgi:tripartite-type tricarboxylate transporter receptor subunit TctC